MSRLYNMFICQLNSPTLFSTRVFAALSCTMEWLDLSARWVLFRIQGQGMNVIDMVFKALFGKGRKVPQLATPLASSNALLRLKSQDILNSNTRNPSLDPRQITSLVNTRDLSVTQSLLQSTDEDTSSVDIISSSTLVQFQVNTAIWIFYTDNVDCSVIECLLSPCENIVITKFSSLRQLKASMQTSHPDAIIVDAFGISAKVCAEIRKFYDIRSLPIIVLTSSKYESKVYKYLGTTINDFILKPVRHVELTTRLNMHLSLRHVFQATKLLDDVYPKHVVQKLMSMSDDNKIDHRRSLNSCMESHSDMSILFSDICGYTTLASSLSVHSVVEILNETFTHFDDICEKYDVYKVETIGDAYMIASGHDAKLGHADRLVQVAVEMIKSVRSLPYGIEIRIGIHSGSAQSGIVGKQRRRYCFFGDTVNVASRMESSGEAMKIHVSEDTFQKLSEAIKEKYCIKCYIDKYIKGKGNMTTYVIDPLYEFS